MLFTQLHRSSLTRRFTALLGVALVLMLNVLAVTPEAHALVHQTEQAAHAGHGCDHDQPADSSEHDCVIVAFAQGHADFGLAPVAVPPLAGQRLGALRAYHQSRSRSLDLRLPPGCGPPAV